MDGQMVKIWTQRFLDKNNVKDSKDLTVPAILQEIGDVVRTLENEQLWELGAEGENYHAENIVNLLAYKSVLEEYFNTAMTKRNKVSDYFDTDTIIKMNDLASDILASNKSDDLKLFKIFKIYSEYLRLTNRSLYYALLGWKNAHLKELLKEQANDVELKLNGIIAKASENNE